MFKLQYPYYNDLLFGGQQDFTVCKVLYNLACISNIFVQFSLRLNFTIKTDHISRQDNQPIASKNLMTPPFFLSAFQIRSFTRLPRPGCQSSQIGFQFQHKHNGIKAKRASRDGYWKCAGAIKVIKAAMGAEK